MPCEIKKYRQMGSVWNSFFQKKAVLDTQQVERMLSEYPEYQVFSNELLAVRDSIENMKSRVQNFIQVLSSKVSKNGKVMFTPPERDAAKYLAEFLEIPYSKMVSVISAIESGGVEPSVQTLNMPQEDIMPPEDGEMDEADRFLQQADPSLGQEQVTLSPGEVVGEIIGVDDTTLGMAIQMLKRVGDGANMVEIEQGSRSMPEEMDVGSLLSFLQIILTGADSPMAWQGDNPVGPKENSDWPILIEGTNEDREAFLSRYNITLQELLSEITRVLGGVPVDLADLQQEDRVGEDLVRNKIKQFLYAVSGGENIKSGGEYGEVTPNFISAIDKVSKLSDFPELENFDLIKKYLRGREEADQESVDLFSQKFKPLIQDIENGMEQTGQKGINSIEVTDFSKSPSLQALVSFLDSGQAEMSRSANPQAVAEARKLVDNIKAKNYRDTGDIVDLIKLALRNGIQPDLARKLQRELENDDWFMVTNAMNNFLDSTNEAIGILSDRTEKTNTTTREYRGVESVSPDEIREFQVMGQNLRKIYEEMLKQGQPNTDTIGSFIYEGNQFLSQIQNIGTSQNIMDIMGDVLVDERGRGRGDQPRPSYREESNKGFLFKTSAEIDEGWETWNPEETKEPEYKDILRTDFARVIVKMLKDLRVLQFLYNNFAKVKMEKM